MRRVLIGTKLAFMCAVVALTGAAPAQADITVGVADSLAKDNSASAERFFETMRDVGMTENRISVVWDAQQPRTIPDKPALDRAVALAEQNGIRITFAVYPGRATAITSSSTAALNFTRFLQDLARAYPGIKDFIVGNEPNKARFWQPVFTPAGKPAACAAYEALLAASYDALKAVDPAIKVIGLGLGPRGSDNPRAPGNLSISPVRCLRDIGRAYRASRRTKPIMDELSYHPHPAQASDALEAGYLWPNAGVPNLPRIKQAVWDAFHGTRQPTFEEKGLPNGPARTLKLRLNEVGWQVSIPPASRGSYYGRESVVTTDEGTQAAIYGNLIPTLACDPAVSSALFFNLVDEPDLDRWQSGLLRADWTRRPAYGIVKGAIAAGSHRCKGRRMGWRHSFRVVEARAKFGDARRLRSPRNTTWSFVAGSDEGTLFSAGIFRVKRPGVVSPTARAAIFRTLRSGRLRKGAAIGLQGKLVGGWDVVVKLPSKRLKPGYYVYAARLVAEMNLARTSLFIGRGFRVGERTEKKSRRS